MARRKVALSDLVGYYPGRIAPILKPHPHEMRVISRGREEGKRLAILGCALRSRTEVVEVTA